MILNLQKFYQACKPSPLVMGNSEERKYYIDFSSVRGANIIQQLEQTITRSPAEPTCQLFTGHIGSGKSTELQALMNSLEKEYFVVYCESGEVLEMGDVDISDILLAIARSVSESLEKSKIKLRSGYFAKRFEEIAKILQRPTDYIKPSEIGLSAGFANVTFQIKDDPRLRAQLRQYLEPRTDEILNAINQEIFAPAKEQLKGQGKKGLVVITDNLDRLGNTVKPNGQTQPEYLFVDRGEQLQKLDCHTVYTIPLVLSFSNTLQRVIDRFGQDINLLPMVPVQLRQGGEDKKGLALLEQMILARAFPDENVVKRVDLIPKVFDNPETLKRLCCVSGGHVRNLLILLSRCIEKEKPPISRDCVDSVVRQRRNQLTRTLTDDEWEPLRQVRQTKKIRGEENYQNLVRNMFVFEYVDEDGSWFDINPILAEAKELGL